MSGPVVIAGASGFVGRALCAELRDAGVAVRAGSRDPDRARAAEPRADWVALDVDRPDTVACALDGADALVFLVHRMRDADHADLIAAERDSAARVLQLATEAGLRRIVYLGATRPQGTPSDHLAARLATGDVLRSGAVSTIELQAGMIIGAGSESWQMVRDLAFRLPVMAVPRWLSTRSQPVALCDVIAAIRCCLDAGDTRSRCLPLPGPEILTAREILLRVASHHGARPVMIGVPLITPSLSVHWIDLVTRADHAVAAQLVDGLRNDLVATGPTFWDAFPDQRPTPFDDAVRAALQAEAAPPLWQQRWERLARRLSRRSREPR